MADEINYVESWDDEPTQCKNCVLYQSKNGKNACVPKDKSFEEALEEYGEVSSTGHCNFFEKK